MPSAILMRDTAVPKEKPRQLELPRFDSSATLSAQRAEELARLGLLLCVAFLHHFLKDLACAVLVTHFFVRLGEIELLLHVVPVIVLDAATRSRRGTEVQVEIVQL